MSQAFAQLAIFTVQAIIITLMIVFILITFFSLISRGKEKTKGKLVVKNLNKKYEDNAELLLAETLPKKQLKQFLKTRKAEEKARNKKDTPAKNIFVLNFLGDMKASAVSSLSEEITAILNVATPKDEVVVRLDSAGGVVHGYGLAAAQLMRIRARNIPLVVAIDKVAASGGYMMACVGNKILSSPFAIIGSIGVVVQLPNFHRWLKDRHIDFELHTAGEFKRTITMFGENTREGRDKLQHEIEDIHELFKNLIHEFRQQVDIAKVATGEHWLGLQAKTLNLVDEIKTSEDYLFEQAKVAKLFEVSYEVRKPLMARLSSSASLLRDKVFGYSVV